MKADLSHLIAVLATLGIKGRCYHASEAAQHMLGRSAWKACTVHHEGVVHWYLQHRTTEAILDLTVGQFKTVPDYTKGRGRGFLTKGPSKKTRALLTLVNIFHEDMYR